MGIDRISRMRLVLALLTGTLLLAACAPPTPTPPKVPGTPSGVVAVAGDESAAVRRSMIISYTVTPYVGLVAQTATTVSGTPAATSAVITGLTNGTAYTFTVAAANVVGSGPESAASSPVTPAPPPPPDAPSNVDAVAGNASATVSWTAPPDGGNAITSYTVTPYIDAVAQTPTTVTGTPPATSTVITGLTNGTAYTFTVTATNLMGTGPESTPSAEVTPTPPPNAPDAPTGVDAVAGNASATVSWTAPPNGGSTITSYTVTPYVDAVAQTPTTVTGTPPATSTVITGLTNGTAYTFTVMATNEVGTGAESAASSLVTPEAPPPPPLPVTIAGGPQSNCATYDNGSVKCWGASYYGSFLSSDVNSATTLPSIVNPVQISGTISHACAVLQTGEVQCWGTNNYGGLGNAVGLGASSSNPTPATVSGITDATDVAVTNFATCAVLSGGGVKCWGWDALGYLGDGAVGPATNPAPVDVVGVTDAATIAGGPAGFCATLNSGGVQCWGGGIKGDGTPSATDATPVTVTDLTDATQVVLGYNYTCALRSSGTVSCWGLGAYGRLGNAYSGPAAFLTPVDVVGLNDAVQISAANPDENQNGSGEKGHTCAVRSTGALVCWGSNYHSQTTSDGTATFQTTPFTVPNVSNAISVHAGDMHTCVLQSGGTARCWGYGGRGQLGYGGTYLANTYSRTGIAVAGL